MTLVVWQIKLLDLTFTCLSYQLTLMSIFYNFLYIILMWSYLSALHYSCISLITHTVTAIKTWRGRVQQGYISSAQPCPWIFTHTDHSSPLFQLPSVTKYPHANWEHGKIGQCWSLTHWIFINVTTILI